MDDEHSNDPFESLFPMPLTSIEKFHWFDDSPEYPNQVFVRFRLNGRLDREQARRALKIVLARQPFGNVRPEKRNGSWHWVRRSEKGEASDSDGFDFRFEEIQSAPPCWTFSDRQPDSSTRYILEIFVWPNHENSDEKFETEVRFSLHHAVGDGVGALLASGEWFVAYANLMAGENPTRRINRLDVGLLAQRNSLGLTTWRYLKHLYKQPIALFGATKFVFRKTAQLIPNKQSSESKQNDGSRLEAIEPAQKRFPAIIGQWIESDRQDVLARHADQHNVMLDSVFVGQLYLALANWRLKLGVHSDRDWIRIILPMSIRRIADRKLPIANRATLVQMDRRIGEETICSGELSQLYAGIDREIRIIRAWELDKMFLLAIRVLSVSDWLLKRSVETDKSRGMAVFTNLSEPLRKNYRLAKQFPETYENAFPYEADYSGPIRQGTPLNFSAARHGNRLRISLHYDSTVLNPSQAENLLSAYVAQLSQVAGS